MLERLEILADTTDEQTLKSHVEKIRRISKGVRMALPDVPFLDYEQHGFTRSRETQSILDSIARAKEGPAAVDLAA
jgi:hypothetical protein